MILGGGKKKGLPEPGARTPDYGIPTVKFDTSKVTQTVKDDLRANIAALPDITPAHAGIVYGAALKAILAGGDLFSLSEALVEIINLAPARAATISTLLHMKAASLMNEETRVKLGIAEAIWVYSGAPCGDPEQDAAHKTADSHKYPSGKGLAVNGRLTFPGREAGCKCISHSVIPAVGRFN